MVLVGIVTGQQFNVRVNNDQTHTYKMWINGIGRKLNMIISTEVILIYLQKTPSTQKKNLTFIITYKNLFFI